MPNPNKDTQTLANFHQNAAELLHQLKTTHRPITLTVDGKPEAVLLDIADYTAQEPHNRNRTDQQPAGKTPAQAVAAIRELRKGNRLDGLRIGDLIQEGRRF